MHSWLTRVVLAWGLLLGLTAFPLFPATGQGMDPAIGGRREAGKSKETFFLQDGQRVAFLGDSITHSGGYIQYLEAYLATRFPDRRFELINLGLSSEGVSGLSEADHPFPRPNVQDRLEAALAKVRPDVVVACYGMNDGIYHPFSEERFQKYQAGIRRLATLSRQAGARVVLMTSPPFDAQPIRAKTRPAGAEKYSYAAPFVDYDRVLDRYAGWLRSLRRSELPVVDLHTQISRYVQRQRAADPEYTLARDGIHPDSNGHWLIAQELLRAWHAPAEVERAEVDARQGKVRRGEVTLSRSASGDLTLRWRTRLPLPVDPQWNPRLAETEQIADHLNRHRLVVTGLPAPRYTLYEGETRYGEVSREELARGLDLTRYPELSTNRKALAVLEGVRRREQLLSAAWLTHVGHQRPDVRSGLPLDDAQRQAEAMTTEIRQLARPGFLELTLKPLF